MARHANPLCDRCCLLSVEQAQVLHGEQGDGCWEAGRCHNRRSYYRHRHHRNRNRRERRQGEGGVETIEIALPLAPTAVLVLYGDQKSRLGVGEAKSKVRTPHALGAEFWVQQRCRARVEGVHCVGWTSRQLDAYVAQILTTFAREYRVSLTHFATVVERPSSACPLHPCPLRG